MKKILYLLFVVVFGLCSCVVDNNQPGVNGNGSGDGKITSLQSLIESAKSGDSIDLSQYSNLQYCMRQ